jgi:hypothetical protein
VSCLVLKMEMAVVVAVKLLSKKNGLILKTLSISWPCTSTTISHKNSTITYICYEHRFICTVSYGHAMLCCCNVSVVLPEDGPLRAETCRSDTMLRKWC